jgi:hypothetical protein
LAAAAGVAIVKPHHPFSAAYQLAEELTRSAKRVVAATDGPLSAYDVHVAHESTLRPLQELRAPTDQHRGSGEVALARHGGPYVVADPDGDVPPDLAARAEQHLLDLGALLAGGTLSSARAHELRGALDRGTEEYDTRLRVALARTASEHARDDREYHAQAVAGLLGPVDDPLGGGRFVRLIDALLLHGVLPRPCDAKVVTA